MVPLLVIRTMVMIAIRISGMCAPPISRRSEEHTSELQSRLHLVCRLLLEKKKKKNSHSCHHAPTYTQTNNIRSILVDPSTLDVKHVHHHRETSRTTIDNFRWIKRYSLPIF